MMDYGPNALGETLDTFNDLGVPHVGAGNNVEEATEVEYAEYDGLRVATLGFTDVLVKGFSAQRYTAGVARATPENIVPAIQEAKKNADLVIVNVHWGIEYNKKPSKRQKEMAKIMADDDEEISEGQHEDVLSEVDVLKNGSVVFYSLGNF